MDYPNYTALSTGLKYYTDAMRAFVHDRLRRAYRNDWWERGVLDSLRPGQLRGLETTMQQAPGKPKLDFLDPGYIETIILRNFRDVFARDFGDYQQTQAWLSTASAARNVGMAHAESGDLQRDEVGHSLYAMIRVLDRAGLPEAEKVEELRKRVLAIGADPVVAPVTARAERPTVAPAPAGDLPYWWQVAQPHEAFLNPAAIDESMFAATLGDVHAGAARKEYLDPAIFFAHTYFTENLTQTIRDVATRLNFGPGPSVTEMQTPFGGGKTHALLTLYHLIAHPEASLAVPGVREALGDVRLPAEARVLVFDGQLHTTEPMIKPDTTTVYTLWGELAYQASPDLYFRLIKDVDVRGEAPGNALFREVLEDASPCLILIDELVSYLVKLRFSSVRKTQHLYRQTVQFLQELLQLAGNVPGVAVLLSLPKSQKEFGGLDPVELQSQLGILEELQARADRVVSKRTPVNDEEIYTLMSKRLFSTVDRAAAERVAAAFREVYEWNRDLYDPAVFSPEYHAHMVAAYPLHPELIDVLYKKWSTASDFPRTRTVLQLLASVVADQWANREPDYAVLSSDVNLERERIRTKIVSAAGSGGGYDAVVAADIAGPGAHAAAWDEQRGGEYERFHVAQGVATTLMMHSFGGAMRPGALPSELYLGSVAPNLGPEYVREVVASLDQSLWYVHREGDLRRFQTRVNIYRAIAQNAESQSAPLVQDRLREAFEQALGKDDRFRVLAWAGDDGTLPDRPDPTVAVLAPTYAVANEGEELRGRSRIDQLWERAGGGLRQWRNAVILVAPDCELWHRTEEVMREVLAYEWAITTGKRKQLDVSDQEMKRLDVEVKDKRQSLRTSIVTAYQWILYPDDQGLTPLKLPVPTRDERIVTRVIQRLSDQDYPSPKILVAISPVYFNSKLAPYLWKTDDPLNLKEGVWGRFPQWTYLPILPKRSETLRACIREGVRQKLWAVAVGDAASASYVQLAEDPVALDEIGELFDGSAYLVRGDWLTLIREQLGHPGDDVEPVVPTGPEPNGSGEKVPPAGPPGTGQPEPPKPTSPSAIAAPARHGRVRISVGEVQIAKTGNLQPYLFKVLQGQDPSATVTITIDVTSTSGIGEDALNRNIVEGLEQLGIFVRWTSE